MMKFVDLCQVKNTLASIVQLESQLKKEVGLNLNQAFALCCLSKKPLNAKELALELKIHDASLSRILKSLEEKKLIHRTVDENDSRQNILTLTPLGLEYTSTLAVCENRFFPWNIE